MFRKFLLSLVLVTLLPSYALAEDSPKVVVETAVNGILHVLKSRQNQNRITLKDREAIRQSLKGYFDFREMAKRSLGRPWRKMDKAQRTDFVDIFRELLERSYGNRLSEYHHQTVEFGKVKIRGRIAIVNSRVVDTKKKVPVRYVLLHEKDGWRVFDIKIEGISMVNTFRSDFKQAVSQKGIDGFLADLKKKVEKMKKQDRAGS